MKLRSLVKEFDKLVNAVRRRLGLRPRVPAARAAQDRDTSISHFDVDPRTLKIRSRR